MASVGELQILPSRVQFPLDSTISYQLIIVNTARSAYKNRRRREKSKARPPIKIFYFYSAGAFLLARVKNL